MVESSAGATEVTTVDVRIGEGALAQEGQTALLHLMIVRGDNRVVLEETWSSGQPAPLVLTPADTLAGVARGVQGMRVGGMRVITMPPAEAFGEEGNASIGLPADTDVIVVAELVGVYGQPTPGAPGTTVPNVVALTTPPTTTTTTTTAVSTVPASTAPVTSGPAATIPATTSG